MIDQYHRLAPRARKPKMSFEPRTLQIATVTVAALIAFLVAYEGLLLTNRLRQRRGDPPLSLRSIRFTIRDLLWLTVVFAFAIGWHLERQKWAPLVNDPVVQLQRDKLEADQRVAEEKKARDFAKLPGPP
jgi:hypothetical protein